MKTIGDYKEIRDLDTLVRSYNLDRIPDKCPLCHCSIQPEVALVYDYGDDPSFNKVIEVVFVCTNRKCRELFIAYYKRHFNEFRTAFELRYTRPYIPEDIDFNKEIETLSPNFTNIYNQAFRAEKFRLNQVCGPGYRKALEFLVKDYSIYKNPGEKEKIENPKYLLGNCIKEFIADPTTRKLAERSAWLGNDETHYTKQWIDKDIEDLKTLITVTANWISNDLVAEKYIEEMN